MPKRPLGRWHLKIAKQPHPGTEFECPPSRVLPEVNPRGLSVLETRYFEMPTTRDALCTVKRPRREHGRPYARPKFALPSDDDVLRFGAFVHHPLSQAEHPANCQNPIAKRSPARA